MADAVSMLRFSDKTPFRVIAVTQEVKLLRPSMLSLARLHTFSAARESGQDMRKAPATSGRAAAKRIARMAHKIQTYNSQKSCPH